MSLNSVKRRYNHSIYEDTFFCMDFLSWGTELPVPTQYNWSILDENIVIAVAGEVARPPWWRGRKLGQTVAGVGGDTVKSLQCHTVTLSHCHTTTLCEPFSYSLTPVYRWSVWQSGGEETVEPLCSLSHLQCRVTSHAITAVMIHISRPPAIVNSLTNRKTANLGSLN